MSKRLGRVPYKLLIDFETTSLFTKGSRGKDRFTKNEEDIFQVGVCVVAPDGTSEEWQSYVYTEQPISFKSYEITGVNTSMLNSLYRAGHTVSTREMIDKVLSMSDSLDGPVVWIAHNGIDFDFPMFMDACVRQGVDLSQHLHNAYYMDTLLMMRQLVPDSFKIENPEDKDVFMNDLMSAHQALLGRMFSAAHDAMADVNAMHDVQQHPLMKLRVEAEHELRGLRHRPKLLKRVARWGSAFDQRDTEQPYFRDSTHMHSSFKDQCDFYKRLDKEQEHQEQLAQRDAGMRKAFREKVDATAMDEFDI